MFAAERKPGLGSPKAIRVGGSSSRKRMWIACLSLFALLPISVCSQSLARMPAAHSTDSSGGYRMGISLAKQGKLDEAIMTFEKALERDPQNERLLNATGAAYSLKGDFDRAKQYFLECLDIDPGFVPARKNLAITYFTMGQYDLAATEFQKLKIASSSSGPVANLFLGMIAEKNADYVQAAKLLEPSATLVGRYPEAVLALAEAELALKHLHNARGALAKLDTARGITAPQYLKAAELHSQLEQNREALADLEKAGAKDSQLDRVAYQRALVLYRMNRSREALTVLKDLADKHPDSDALNLLARVAKENGDVPLAMQSLRQAAKLDPARENNYLDFSTICADYGNYPLALEAANIGLGHLPNSYRLLVQKGVALESLGRLGEAEEILRQASQLQKDNSVALLSLAIVQTHANQLNEAEATLTSALASFPDNYYMHYYLGKVLVQLQEITPTDTESGEKAKRAFQKSIRCNPTYADSYYQLAKIYLRESPKQAEQNLVRCLRLDPNHAPAEYALARLYLSTGRRAAGRAMLGRFERQQRRDKLTESQRPRIESAEN